MAVSFFEKGAWTGPSSNVTVVVFIRRKFARVDWDFFRLPEQNDAFMKEHAADLQLAVQDIYLKHGNDRAEFYGNGLVGHMDGLLVEQARIAAQDIADLFDDYVRRRELAELIR